MKIAFFEVEDWERDYLKERLPGHELRFYRNTLDAAGAGEVKDVEVLSVFIYSPINKAVLEQLPQLKLIVTRSTGFDHIDLDECKRRNIKVCNVPSYGENTVAEHTFALILSLSRNLYKATIKRLTSDFSTQGLRGFDLKGKTLGVVGTGRIGLHVIRIAKGFGMNVLAFDTHPSDILAEVLDFTYVPLEKLLQESQIVTLHVPYNKYTHHLINAERLALMPRGSFLINTARGAIVDTEALIKALSSGRLAGAGLDVLEGEEFIKEETDVLREGYKQEVLTVIAKNEILLRRQNVVYTPHIGFDSQEALERILDTTVNNINNYVSGRACPSVA
jgi:D-lactate dehydrogenase